MCLALVQINNNRFKRIELNVNLTFALLQENEEQNGLFWNRFGRILKPRGRKQNDTEFEGQIASCEGSANASAKSF